MATHYRGQRIADLLDEIAMLQQHMDDTIPLLTTPTGYEQYSQAYTIVVLAKAKLTALQGEDK